MRAKSWTDSERELVDPAFRDLLANPRANLVIAKLASDQTIKVLRNPALREIGADGKPVQNSDALAFFVEDINGIVFTDRMFQLMDVLISSCRGYYSDDPRKEIAMTAFHEMLHAYSEKMGYFENDCGFLAAIGWKDGAVSGVSSDQLKELMRQKKELIDQRKLVEAGEYTRMNGRKFGFPNLYAMTEPRECFAEVVTAYLLDEKMKTYLKPSIVQWLDDYFRNPQLAKACPPRPM